MHRMKARVIAKLMRHFESNTTLLERETQTEAELGNGTLTAVRVAEHLVDQDTGVSWV